MKYTTLFTLFLVGVLRLSAQITAGQRLVGANALAGAPGMKHFQIPLNVGFFVAHNVALGGTLCYSNAKATTPGSASSYAVGVGGFVRVYALPERLSSNVVLHVAYQYDSWKDADDGYTRTGNPLARNLMIAAGPVLMMSRNISLEFLLGYNAVRRDTDNGWILGIGFYGHLGQGRTPKVAQSGQ